MASGRTGPLNTPVGGWRGGLCTSGLVMFGFQLSVYNIAARSQTFSYYSYIVLNNMVVTFDHHCLVWLCWMESFANSDNGPSTRRAVSIKRHMTRSASLDRKWMGSIHLISVNGSNLSAPSGLPSVLKSYTQGWENGAIWHLWNETGLVIKDTLIDSDTH